jgi:cytochrome c
VVERLSAMGVPENLKYVILDCMNCHSFSEDRISESAPPLWGVVGRSIGASDYPNYSNALRERSSDKWDHESLRAFITNPQNFALGSTMPATSVMDEQTLDGLVEYLQTLN